MRRAEGRLLTALSAKDQLRRELERRQRLLRRRQAQMLSGAGTRRSKQLRASIRDLYEDLEQLRAALAEEVGALREVLAHDWPTAFEDAFGRCRDAAIAAREEAAEARIERMQRAGVPFRGGAREHAASALALNDLIRAARGADPGDPERAAVERLVAETVHFELHG